MRASPARIALLGLLGAALGVGYAVRSKRPFDWRERMPPDFRLVASNPAETGLAKAWREDRSNWIYEASGSPEEVEKTLLEHLGPGWKVGREGLRREDPRLRITELSTKPAKVRIEAYGEILEPSAFARWTSRLPLDRIGIVANGRVLIDRHHSIASDREWITRRR